MLTINEDLFTVEVGGKSIELTKTEFDILYYLVSNKHRVVSKTELIDKLWHKPVFENTVEVYVKYLRDKIGANYIVTRRGFGYRAVIE